MSLERTNIANMRGYIPGEQPRQGNFIKLNTNENPYPPSPEVQAALNNIQISDLRRYPQALAEEFRKIAAEHHKVREENIIPTNGGDELLRLALTTFVEPKDKIIITQPSYSLYPILAEVQNCELIEVPLLDDWSMPPDFIETLNRHQATMCILVNPHAPTGKLLPTEYIKKLSTNFAGVLVIDEAYVDFVDVAQSYDSIPLVEQHKNLLLLRTLSKGYSLAGLRFGYGIAHESLINPIIYKTKDSYNTDHIAQKLACAALQARSYVEAGWKRIRNSRLRLTKELNNLSLPTETSHTNFILSQVPLHYQAETLYKSLKERNILVRHFQQPRLEDKLRITVGSDEENAVLIRALGEILT